MKKRIMKILIFGDSLTNSTNFAKIIHEAIPETEIIEALNGIEGIRLAKTFEPDVILIDVSTSKKECLEISQIIKKEKVLLVTPMLFITDLEGDREFRIEALKAGADAFLFKPIEDTILITQLKSMVKIKERNMLIKDQTEQLELLVEYRTKELKQEIDERKRLETELRKSEEIFKTYIKKAPIGVVTINAEGQYIDANRKACEMMGATREEILCQHVTDYFAANYVEEGLAGFRELLNKGDVIGEYKVSKGDNKDYWISLIGTKINDNCFLAFYIDISERKLSEDKLILRLQQTIDTISKIGELKDAYTAGHQKNVVLLSCAIAREMKLPEDTIENIAIGALIHDIGKINIPFDILNKPGKITSLEYQILQSHVENSYEIVKDIDFPPQVIEMILQHHERLDGSGYPNKLTGEEIIIESRIMAVADVVEAMVSHRPYRAALGIDVAIDEITMYRGIKYDSKVVDTCIKLFRELGFTFSK